jgi:hypothetical protein
MSEIASLASGVKEFSHSQKQLVFSGMGKKISFPVA